MEPTEPIHSAITTIIHYITVFIAMFVAYNVMGRIRRGLGIKLVTDTDQEQTPLKEE
jgi:hypothetical protein